MRVKDRINFRLKVIFLLYKGVYENLEELKLNNDAYQKAILVTQKLTEIDEIISKNLENYTINRLSKLDLSIIRYAVYEIFYDKLHKAIAINEAVSICKKYTDLENGKQHKFTNSLLDKIAKGFDLNDK